MQWLETLPHHSYDVRDAGPPTMLPPKQTSATSENSNSTVKPEDQSSSTDNVDSTNQILNSSVHTSSNLNTETCSTKDSEIKCEC